MRFAFLAFLLPLTAVSCGGSSSETPPPLEPDPTSARYSGPRVPRADDPQPAAAAAAAAPEEDDAPVQPRHPAPATWGK